MTRYKLTIEYDGAPYCGWQRQHDQPSVQAALERAAAALDEREVQVFAAGRTDAGVHALGQVAHVDLAKTLRADTVRDALNHHLRPDPVVVLDDNLLVACGDGALRLTRLQKAGGRVQEATAFLRGRSLAKGTILP